jgi:two-component system phosphate regulon sensor histidine kinase PhoR
VRSPRSLPYRLPLLAGLLAVVAAAGLVVYLQHQAVTLERQRTAIIVRQICERSVSALTSRLSDLFGGAVLEAIEGIGHPELKNYNLARVDRFFRAGVTKFPYVDRFFLWHERAAAPFREQVVFYRPPNQPGRRDVAIEGEDGPHGAFFGDPVRGAPIWRAARQFATMGRSFAIEDVVLDGVRYQAVFHILWADPQRQRFYCVAGYLVDLEAVRRTQLAQLVRTGIEPYLNLKPDSLPLALRVTDTAGAVVYGSTAAPTADAASQPFDLLFFPRVGMEPYLATAPATPKWTLTVLPASEPAVTAQSSVWLLAAVVLLLAVAVVCAVSVNRQAIRLSELQSDFVANVSHQLRTPLAMLSAAAETLGLERVRSPEKVREYADIVRVQAQRLSVLIDQILHFHRAELAGRDAVRRPVDLGELIERAAEQFRLLADRASVAIRVEHPAPAPVVHGDPMALEYAVVNLLENAVKYGGPGASEVVVSVRVQRGYGVISVRDTGLGISAVDIPHIFDKFYRGRTEGRPLSGFGLGLAIVRSTVMVHGGRIAVDSQPGRGSEFTVWLPLQA